MNPIQQQFSNTNQQEPASNSIVVKIPNSCSFWIQIISFIVLFICYFLSFDKEQRYLQATVTYLHQCPNQAHLCKWIVMYPYLNAFSLSFTLLAIFCRFKAQQLRWKADWMILFDVLATTIIFITIILFVIFVDKVNGYEYVFAALPVFISLSLILQCVVLLYDRNLRTQILTKNPQRLEIIYSIQLFLQLMAIIFASITLGLEISEQVYQTKEKYYYLNYDLFFTIVTNVTGQQQCVAEWNCEYLQQLRFSSCFDSDFCNFVVALPYLLGVFLFFVVIQIICRNQGKQIYGLSLFLGIISELLIIILVLMLIIFYIINPIDNKYFIEMVGNEPFTYYDIDTNAIISDQKIKVAPIIFLGLAAISQGVNIVFDYKQRIKELQNKQ